MLAGLLAGSPYAAAAPVYATACAPPLYVAGDAESPDDCGVRAGDPLGDARGGAPAGEFIDLLTNVVYRLEEERLHPVGLSQASFGYVDVNACRNGEYSGDPVTDFGCVGDAFLYGKFCGACPGDPCVQWRVALTGSHEIELHQDWYNYPTDDCIPWQHHLTHNIAYPAEGGIVTEQEGSMHHLPPWSGCGEGYYYVKLLVDDVVVAQDSTPFGTPAPYPCAYDTVYFAQYGHVYLDSCAPCWRQVTCKVGDVTRGGE